MSRWTKLVEGDYQGMHVYVGVEPFRPLYDSDSRLNDVRAWTRIVIVDRLPERWPHVNTWGDLEQLLRAQLHDFGSLSLFYTGETAQGPLRLLPTKDPFTGPLALRHGFVDEIRSRGADLAYDLPEVLR